MNKRKLFIVIGIVLIIAAVIGGIWMMKKKSDNSQSQAVSEFTEVSPYDVTDEKAEAMKKLEQGIEPSNIVSNDDTTEKYIGLAFSGLSDSVTNQKILSLLEEYGRKATFFIPAIGAVECEDDVADMMKQGHAVGSNTLNSTAHMEEMSQEELINDFCVSNKVIKALSDEDKPLLQCNATVYTDELLKAANACGNPQVVYSTHFINYQSFTSYVQVLSYINKLPRGTILTIKIHGVLDDIEMEDKEVDQDPARDKQVTIDSDQKAFLELPEEDRLPQIVEWILLALEETNYQTRQIEDFGVDNSVDTSVLYDEDYAQEENQKQVYSYFPMSSPYIGLQLRGIADTKKLEHVLEILKEHEATATFYVTAKEAGQYPLNIQKILDAGCTVANGGMDEEALTGHTEQEVRAAIQACNEKLSEYFEIDNSYFMPPEGEYDSAVREAASKEQMTILTYNRCPIIQGGKSLETTMKNFTDSLSKGSLIYVNLESYEKSDEVIDEILSCVDAKKYQTASISTLFQYKTNENDILLAAVQIPDVLSEEETARLRKENEAREAYQTKQVYTTERALAFAFSGISEQKALDSVLSSMNQMGARGTFFVSYAEMQVYPDRIRKIIEAGNEIGIAFIPADATTFSSCCNEIAAAQEYMEENFNLTPRLVMNTVSHTEKEEPLAQMREAVSAMGCRMTGSAVSVVQSSLKGISSAGSYYANLSKSNFEIQMGQIIYTRLDYLSSPSILGEVLKLLKEDRIDPIAYYDEQLGQNMWAYNIKTVSSVLYNTADGGSKLYSLNNGSGAAAQIGATKYDLSDNTALMSSISKGYIGNIDVAGPSELPGFTRDELKTLDTTGKMPGNKSDNYVFLSFDDWGTDVSINHLLYVLDKYQLKATFFVRSNNVSANPNLLRAIAANGHEIGSHTSSHFRLANDVQGDLVSGYPNASLSDEDAAALRDDVVKSYQEMYKIVGNYAPNGYPALVPIFRPPTLAVSKAGLKQIFESGYQFSISGDFSTQDYKYKKADGGAAALADKLQNGFSSWEGTRRISSHSIVVMHMSGTSEVTAEAIQKWMENGARSQFNFNQPIYQYLVTH